MVGSGVGVVLGFGSIVADMVDATVGDAVGAGVSDATTAVVSGMGVTARDAQPARTTAAMMKHNQRMNPRCFVIVWR